MSGGGRRRILVIRLGALGDFFLSLSAFAAIRAHETDAEITLLTTAPFAEIARQSPWFDRVSVDRRPAVYDVPGLLRLRGQLRGFDFIYDLQTSTRSSRYFWLAGQPQWSGIARGSSHLHANLRRDFMHTRERQADQLAMAGVPAVPPPDLGWLIAMAKPFDGLPPRFALLVPGASPHRQAKRWPVDRYADLAATLSARGIAPVVIGAANEAKLAARIPAAIDLTGQTGLADIAALAVRAEFAVGNDTGPMHVAAAMGCPCVVLFSAESEPALTAPRGPSGEWPALVRAPDLGNVTVEQVIAALPCEPGQDTFP